MGQFFEWVLDPKNINANIFTLLSVVLSGLVSWIISAAYFSVGNRNTLKSAILHPVRRLLEQPPSWSNYRTLTELTKEHSIKYLQKCERSVLDELLLAYEDVCRYNYAAVCAESLSSYFKNKLKKNGIDPSPIPIYIEDELVGVDVPADMLYFKDDLARAVMQYPPEYDTDNFTKVVQSLFKHYCKTCYTDKEIVFFDDHAILTVLKRAKIRSEWDEKFRRYRSAKEAFLERSSFN